MPLIRGGQLRALAVTSETRHPFLPEVPTVSENGYPGYKLYTWVGLWSPWQDAGRGRQIFGSGTDQDFEVIRVR